eukprot:6284394-Amphidinium_carterae.1
MTPQQSAASKKALFPNTPHGICNVCVVLFKTASGLLVALVRCVKQQNSVNNCEQQLNNI